MDPAQADALNVNRKASMAQIVVELSKIKAIINKFYTDPPPPTDSSTPATSKGHNVYEKQNLPTCSGQARDFPEFRKLWKEEAQQMGAGHQTVLLFRVKGHARGVQGQGDHRLGIFSFNFYTCRECNSIKHKTISPRVK